MIINMYYVIITHGTRGDGSEYANARVDWIRVDGETPFVRLMEVGNERYGYYFCETRRMAVQKAEAANELFRQSGVYGYN